MICVPGGRLVINPHKPGKDDQLWERKGSAIVNIGDKKVLDIAGKKINVSSTELDKEIDNRLDYISM